MFFVSFGHGPLYLNVLNIHLTSGSRCKQGEAEGIVIATGARTFLGRAASLVGQDNATTSHLRKILAQMDAFCVVATGIFVLADILIHCI